MGEETGLGWHLRNKLVNVILCVALAGPLFFGIAFHPVVVQNVSGGYFDFVSFYTAGQVVKQGLRKHLYNYDTQREFQRNLTGRPAPLPYNHTPFETLIFVPLTFVPYLWAYRLWVLVNLLLIGFSAYLLRLHLESIRGLFLRLALLLSLSIPMFVNILQGQDSILMLFLFTLAFVSMKRNQESRAGCFLALALLKFQMVLPLMPVFFVKRRWNMVFSFLSVSALLAVTSLCLIGWGGLRDWLNLVHSQNENLAYGGGGAHTADRTILPLAMANLRGLLYALLAGSTRPLFLDLLVGVCSVILVAWAVTRWKGRYEAGGLVFDLLFALNLVVALLATYHFYLHDLVLIGLPILLVFSHIERLEPPRSLRRIGFIGSALLLFLLLVFLFRVHSRQFYLLSWILLALTILTSAEITETRRREAEARPSQGVP